MAFARYTIRQLDAFVCVAEHLSFAEAAQRLGLTPSAVSQLVNELEGVLDFKLFERSTRKVALSAAGREFLNAAVSVLRQVREADSIASDVRNRAVGTVRVAAPLVLASIFLPRAMRSHAERYPQVKIHIHDASVEKLVDLVAQGDVDMALGPDRSHGANVARASLFASPWVLWCAPDHPLVQQEDSQQVRWDALRAHAIVAAGRDHERNVEQMQAGLPDSERISPIDIVDNISTAMGIAAAGLALTLSPAYVEPLAAKYGLVMRRIVEPEVTRQVCLYRPTQRIASPAAEGFAEHLLNSLPQQLAAP
jgi:DNA-binding transcriptional LysR family regulator